MMKIVGNVIADSGAVIEHVHVVGRVVIAGNDVTLRHVRVQPRRSWLVRLRRWVRLTLHRR